MIISYSWGNQQGIEFLAEAYYDGSLKQFLQGYFDEVSAAGGESHDWSTRGSISGYCAFVHDRANVAQSPAKPLNVHFRKGGAVADDLPSRNAAGLAHRHARGHHANRSEHLRSTETARPGQMRLRIGRGTMIRYGSGVLNPFFTL